MLKTGSINLLFFSLLIALSYTVNCQSKYTDSLEAELNITDNKKVKLDILIKLAKEYAPISFEKGTKYSKEAQSLALGLQDKKLEAEAKTYLGDAYSYSNKFEESNTIYNEALILAENAKCEECRAILFNSIGLNDYYIADYSNALIFFNKALSFSLKNNLKVQEGNAYFNIGQVYRKQKDNRVAAINYQNALKAFEQINELNGLAKVYNSLGIVQAESGDYNEAVTYYKKALVYREKMNDKKGCAILYNNIGNIYLKWGKYNEAIIEYQKAIKIFERLGHEEGIARSSNNIGLIYENLTRGENFEQNLGNYNRALEFHQRALKIWETLDKPIEIANSLNNIANVNARLAYTKITNKYGANWENNLVVKDKTFIGQEYLKAIEYYKKSLSIREKIGDKNGLAGSLTNLGKIFTSTGNYIVALSYLKKALYIYEELNLEYEISSVYYDISLLYYSKQENELALQFLYKSLELATKNELTNIKKDLYLLLSKIYQSTGDYKNSLLEYKKYVDLQDSLLNENNLKQIAEIQTQYETEKKEQRIQLLNKDAKLKDIQIKQKNTTIYFFFAALLFVIAIIILLFRQNKERKKVNQELELRNKLITVQKQEITDSIHYARRIQNAVMPYESQLRQLLPDSFIFFKPRDIVSGDFYWVAEKKNKVVVATADCTGHGVPGAFMSMLGIALLNNIVSEMEELKAHNILNVLRGKIIESLHQSGREGENKDGMDISLYIIDTANMSLEYAGANNPLYIVRNGNLIEAKADRMPIGIHEKSAVPFNSNIQNLEKGDMIYTFSDGYSDQFGGPNGKKFMSANLKKLFVSIYKKPIELQHEIINDTIIKWMNDISQIDDMMIIGVRV